MEQALQDRPKSWGRGRSRKPGRILETGANLSEEEGFSRKKHIRCWRPGDILHNYYSLSKTQMWTSVRDARGTEGELMAEHRG